MGGYLGSPLSWDRSIEGEEGSGRFLRQDRCCSAVASPRHTTPHVSPGGSPALPSHTKLLPRGSPRAFSPLCLCSGAHPTRWKRNPCIYTSIHKSFLQDAEVERTRQAMRVSECPLSAVQDTQGQEHVLLSFVSQIPSPQFVGVGLKSRLQELPRLTGRQCTHSLKRGCNYYRLLFTPK